MHSQVLTYIPMLWPIIDLSWLSDNIHFNHFTYSNLKSAIATCIALSHGSEHVASCQPRHGTW